MDILDNTRSQLPTIPGKNFPSGNDPSSPKTSDQDCLQNDQIMDMRHFIITANYSGELPVAKDKLEFIQQTRVLPQQPPARRLLTVTNRHVQNDWHRLNSRSFEMLKPQQQSCLQDKVFLPFYGKFHKYEVTSGVPGPPMNLGSKIF